MKLTKRELIRGAGATGLAAGTGGTIWWGLSGTVFAPGEEEEELETLADAHRGNLENLIGELDEEGSSGSLQRAINDVSVPSDPESYTGRGVQLTDKFNVAIPADPQSFQIPREVDGDAVVYTWQEGTGPVSLDGTVSDIKRDVPLSSENERLFDDLKEEFGDVVLYTATTEDGQPDYDDGDIEKLAALHNELAGTEDTTGEYEEVLQELDELGSVITASSNLEQRLEGLDFQKSHKIAGHEVWGQEFTGDQITKAERNALLDGEEPYEDIGVEETYDTALDAYVEGAEHAFRIGLVTELIGQTVADARGQLEQYGEQQQEPEEPTGPEDYEDLVPDSCGYEDRVAEDLSESGYEPSELEVTVESDGELFVESTVDDWSRNYAAECS